MPTPTNANANPSHLSFYDFMFLALAHGELGEAKEAKSNTDELLKIRSDLSAEVFLAEGEFAPEATSNRSLFLHAWKKAGLPYCAKAEQLQRYPHFLGWRSAMRGGARQHDSAYMGAGREQGQPVRSSADALEPSG